MIKYTLVLLSVFLLCGSLGAQTNINGRDLLNVSENLELVFGTESGYTGNLLLDSAAVEDAYNAANASAYYYPFSFMELSFENEFTYYNKRYNLSSYLGRGGITLVPTSDESPVSLYLSGKFDFRKYHDNMRSFNNNNLEIVASLGWEIAEQASVRLGYIYRANDYIHSEVSGKKKYETFLGGNWTFLGSNTIDVEVGWSIMDYSFISDTNFVIDTLFSDLTVSDYFTDGYLISFWVSPRFSRGIGSKTGINLIFNYQTFSNEENSIILLSQFDFISPYANITQGRSIETNIKSYLLPGFIITTGVGYWHKTYLKMYDGEFDFEPLNIAKERVDEQSRWYLNFEYPLLLGHSGILTPSLKLDYSNNVSNFDNFDYYVWNVSGGITFRFE